MIGCCESKSIFMIVYDCLWLFMIVFLVVYFCLHLYVRLYGYKIDYVSMCVFVCVLGVLWIELCIVVFLFSLNHSEVLLCSFHLHLHHHHHHHHDHQYMCICLFLFVFVVRIRCNYLLILILHFDAFCSSTFIFSVVPFFEIVFSLHLFICLSCLSWLNCVVFVLLLWSHICNPYWCLNRCFVKMCLLICVYFLSSNLCMDSCS